MQVTSIFSSSHNVFYFFKKTPLEPQLELLSTNALKVAKSLLSGKGLKRRSARVFGVSESGMYTNMVKIHLMQM